MSRPHVFSSDSSFSRKAGSAPFEGGSHKDATPRDNTLLTQVVLFIILREHPSRAHLVMRKEGVLQEARTGPPTDPWVVSDHRP